MSRERRPAVRAVSVRDALSYLDKFQPGATRRVRSAIPDDVLAIIDSTPRLAWVDIEDEGYVPATIWSVLGDDEATEMIVEFLQSHLHIPLLGALVETTRKLFGLSPSTALRVLPTGWKLIYRDFGGIEVHPTSDRSAEVVLSDLPRSVIDSDTRLALFRAHFLGIIRMTGYSGDAQVVQIDRPNAQVRYELSWT
jgi:hypothetical protein